MDQHYIDILEYLEPYGIGVYTDLSPFLHQIFPLKDKKDIPALNESAEKVVTLVRSMKEHITLENPNTRLGYYLKGIGGEPVYAWLDDVKMLAHITVEGLEFLNSLRSQRLSASVSNSVIKTNQATTLLYKRQNRLYYVTLSIALLSVLFPALSYFRDSRVNVLNGEIIGQKKVLSRSEAEVRRLQHSYDSLYMVVDAMKKGSSKPK